MINVIRYGSHDRGSDTVYWGARIAATSALLLLSYVAIAAGQSRCDATKLQQVGRRALCLTKVDARAAQRGEPVDAERVQKCHAKFADRCAEAEGMGDCTAGVKSCAELIADVGACPDQRTFLIDVGTASPIVEVVSPKSGANCASRELHFLIGPNGDIGVETCDRDRLGAVCAATDVGDLRFRSRSAPVSVDMIKLGTGDPAGGPIEPVQGPDDLLWLCREDEEGMQCICIPWAQD